MNNPIPRFIAKQSDVAAHAKEADSKALEAQAVRGVEAVNMLVAERDQLRQEVLRLTERCQALDIANQHLEGQLHVASARADHYQRYTTEMLTNFHTFEMLMNDMKAKGRKAAFEGNTILKLGADDEARLSELAEKLSPPKIDRVKP